MGPGPCGGCCLYRVRAPLTLLFLVVSGLRCSVVEWWVCGLGHLWFVGFSFREFFGDLLFIHV